MFKYLILLVICGGMSVACKKEAPPPSGQAPIPPIPMGRLGLQIGTYVTLEAEAASSNKAGLVAVTAKNINSIRVFGVNGEVLPEPIVVGLPHHEERGLGADLPMNQRLHLRGYETGRWIGSPNQAHWDGLPPSAAGFQFQTYFVAVKYEVVLPGTP